MPMRTGWGRWGLAGFVLIIGLGGGRSATAQRSGLGAEDRTMVQEILQRKDKDLRQQRLVELLKRLADPATDAAGQAAALGILQGVHDVPFDRTPYRQAALGLLTSPSPAVRAASLADLPSAGAGQGDLAAMARLADDADAKVRANVAGALFFAQGAANTPLVFPVVEKLLADPNDAVKLATLHSLWGNPVSPASEAQIIALSRGPMSGGPGALGYDAIYYALSTRPVMSLPVAQRLAELMHEPDLDPNVRWRAAWGLTHPAAPEAIDAMVQALSTELDETLQPQVRKYAVQGLATHRTPAALAKLRDLAAHEESPAIRAAAAEALK